MSKIASRTPLPACEGREKVASNRIRSSSRLSFSSCAMPCGRRTWSTSACGQDRYCGSSLYAQHQRALPGGGAGREHVVDEDDIPSHHLASFHHGEGAVDIIGSRHDTWVALRQRLPGACHRPDGRQRAQPSRKFVCQPSCLIEATLPPSVAVQRHWHNHGSPKSRPHLGPPSVGHSPRQPSPSPRIGIKFEAPH